MDEVFVSQEQRRAAVDRIEAYARSMCAIKGLPAPGPEVLSPIIDSTVAGLTAHQQRHPDAIPLAALGDLHQALLRVSQTHKAANFYGADGARQAPGDGEGKGAKRGFADPLNLSLSSARFQEIVDSGRHGGLSVSASGDTLSKTSADLDWGSSAGLSKMRDFALRSGLPWAANNPDLLRLGPAAIGALAEAHLKSGGYAALHDREHLNFDNKTIVAGADYMKRNKANYDEAAKAAAAVDGLKQLTPEERALHRETERGLLVSKPGESERAAKQRYIEMGDKLIEHHHGDKQVTSTVERERKAHHVQKEIEHRAEAKTQVAQQTTQARERQASSASSQAQNAQKAEQAGQTNFAALLKNAPKGPGH